MTIYSTPEAFEDLTTSRSEKFGSAVGQGLGSGLQLLAQDKLEKIKHKRLQHLINELSSTPSAQADTRDTGEQRPREGVSDEAILALSTKDPNLARLLQSQKEAQEKQTESKAKRHFERAKPVLARADERAESISLKENSLSLMENAIQEGNLGFLSLDNFAEITGIEGFRSAKGAQFTAAIKEYFLGSLKRAGARPNQWIEQQIKKMLPEIGRSTVANQTVIEALRSDLAIEKSQLDIIDRLSQEDENKFGYIRGDIGQRARKELTKFANQENKDLEKRLRTLQSQEEKDPSKQIIKKTEVIMLDPQGKRRAVEKKDVKAAKAAGYELSS